MKKHVKIAAITVTILIAVALIAFSTERGSEFWRRIFYVHYNFDICKSGLHYRKDIMDEVSLLLKNNDKVAQGYIAVKELSRNGLAYFLLVQYPLDGLMISYRAKEGTFKTKALTRLQSDNIAALLIGKNDDEIEDYNGGDSFHFTCDYIAVHQSGKQRSARLLNASFGYDITPSVTLLSKVRILIENEHKGPDDVYPSIELPPHLTEQALTKLDDEVGDDYFYELRVLKLKENH